jgi:hypothetical protein
MANYVRHWRASCQAFGTDERFTPSHISLYVALFHFWNEERFAEPFRIFRDKVMIFARIASPTTYYRCMHDLTEWGYITYYPSPARYQTSTVVIHGHDEVKSDTAHEPGEASLTPKNDIVDVSVDGTQVSTYNTNNINHTNISKERKRENTHAPIEKCMNDKVATRPHQFTEQNTVVEGGAARPASLPKTLGEVKEYFRAQRSNDMEAEKFFRYYKSNGWLVGGRTPMKDWQSSACKWMLDADRYTQHTGPRPGHLQSPRNQNYAEPL